MTTNEKIKFFDIETTGLNADESFVIAVAFNENVYFLENPRDEKNFIEKLFNEFKDSIIVGYNIQRFDLPFLFSKAVEHKIFFENIMKVKYIDLMDIVLNKTKLGKKTASNINTFLGFKRDFPNSHYVPKNYILYLATKEQKYKEEIIEHLKEDIEITKRIFNNFIRHNEEVKNYIKVFTF